MKETFLWSSSGRGRVLPLQELMVYDLNAGSTWASLQEMNRIVCGIKLRIVIAHTAVFK